MGAASDDGLVEELRPGLILLHSPEHLDGPAVVALLGRVDEVAVAMEQFTLVAVVESLHFPDYEVRHAARDWFSARSDRLAALHIVMGNNVLIRTAAKFVMRGLPVPVHHSNSLDEALAALA
ncbi:MAG: hypothetical protein KDC39_00810 [Actinobacteria bacterium]|nr:hypothetical protein [Actinomycetota bacterium]